MSKLVIYILDKIVWMLLITAVAAQALQIVGVVKAPHTGLEHVSYAQGNEYTFQVQAEDGEIRGKRQTDARTHFIDNLFNIPIATLSAVNKFLQSAEPLVQNWREKRAKNRNSRVNATPAELKPEN